MTFRCCKKQLLEKLLFSHPPKKNLKIRDSSLVATFMPRRPVPENKFYKKHCLKRPVAEKTSPRRAISVEPYFASKSVEYEVTLMLFLGND